MGQIRIGTSGFSYKEWKPRFYPEDVAAARFLEYYASKFDSVEIDSTFYRMPTVKTLAGWKQTVGPGFRFAIKASRRITHWERLRTPSETLQYLLDTLPELDDRLGVVLYQLPPNFPADAGRLEAFLEALRPGIRSAFEFRHDSWFNDEVYRLLQKHRAALCIHDGDEQTTPLQLTADFTYVRLRRSAYPDAERRLWRSRMQDWAREGVEVFAYIKHEDNPDAPLVALQFSRPEA